MRRTRKDIEQVQDRRAEVVRLRAEGRTFDEIAELTGFAGSSGAWKAWQQAIKQRPDATVDEVRQNEKARLDQMDSVMAAIIRNPPLRGTATGAVMLDIRSCTCGSRSDKRRDHTEDCEIVPVVDAAAIIRASAERRALGESLRKLTGADAPSSSAVTITDNSTRIIADIKQWHVEHPDYRRTPGSTVPPGVEVQGPAAVHAWEADREYRLQLEQRNKKIGQ